MARLRFDPLPSRNAANTPTIAQTGKLDDGCTVSRCARSMGWSRTASFGAGVATMWCGPRSSMSWWMGTSVGEKLALSAWSDSRAGIGSALRVIDPQKESRDDASDDASRVFVLRESPRRRLHLDSTRRPLD